MAAPRNTFSFADCSFDEVVAHDGIGKIRTVRVAGKEQFRGLSYIDLTEVPPGASIGIHSHGPTDEEVYVIISGRGRMSDGKDEFLVNVGDVIVNPAGGTHGLENTGEKTLRMVVLDIPV